MQPASGRGGTLHVYLAGDGTPWITRTRISTDPTPRNPVALRLMLLDPSPSLFLGRPCYHGLAGASGCDSALWTHARYSEPVVRSMAHALERIVAERGAGQVVLIGYSGGGVLGWLIAERVRQVRGLVTIASNLDTEAWTRLHGYTPLYDSLNPAVRATLPSRVAQLHLAGARDKNVPPKLVRDAVERPGSNSAVVALASDHRCCWERLWPGVLERVERLDSTQGLERANAEGRDRERHESAG